MLRKCTAESFFRRAVFLHTVCEKMSGSPRYTPYTVLIPWVEQCITKRLCGVNLWSSQSGCACGPGADDFPVLQWGITLMGQWRDAEWCSWRKRNREEETLQWWHYNYPIYEWQLTFSESRKLKLLSSSIITGIFNFFFFFFVIKQCCRPRFVIERASFYQWLRFWLQCKIFGLIQHFLNFKPFSHPCWVFKFVASNILHVLAHIKQIMKTLLQIIY